MKHAGPLRRPGSALAGAGLVLAMAVGSLALWTLLPLAWLWAASNVVESNLFVYLFALVACPVTIVLGASALYRVEAVYLRTTGRPAQTAARAAWLKSLRAERGRRRGLGLLDVFMIASAVFAVVSFLLFVVLAGSGPETTGPLAPGDEHGR